MLSYKIVIKFFLKFLIFVEVNVLYYVFGKMRIIVVNFVWKKFVVLGGIFLGFRNSSKIFKFFVLCGIFKYLE